MSNSYKIEKIQGNDVFLDFFETKHLRVLRKKKDDVIFGLDGLGNIYKIKITQIDSKYSKGKIIESKKYFKPLPYINLYISSIKWKRLKIAIEKATEISVSSIHIFRSKFSNIKYDPEKREKFQTTISEAAKQSLNPFFPDIFFHDDYPVIKEGLNIVCDLNGIKLKKIENEITESKIINVFIGPEGGFTEEDFNFINNPKRVKISSNILKAETASIHIITILNYLTNRV